MNTRDRILLVDLLIDYIRSEKKVVKAAMVNHWDAFMKPRADNEETDNIAWWICNVLGDLIALRGDIARLLQIRQELL